MSCLTSLKEPILSLPLLFSLYSVLPCFYPSFLNSLLALLPFPFIVRYRTCHIPVPALLQGSEHPQNAIDSE
ncbi:hypothetical protein BDV34DRAFT_196060 [Aspergillus parasiticus]|uniref:Uncharacterized protein n=1 Tax=Aspergillus parasiticus TaxID=5067 RepID=A0A5N6DJQ3_ASPPA|nr:hypothetical protein BDV34DRAFT_196060 [Aspergillus parasiticus]